MRLRSSIYILSSLFLMGTLSANEEERLFSYWDLHPWKIGGQFLATGKSSCRRHLGKVSFNKTNAFTQILLPVNRENFFTPRIEYNYVTFDWNQNPYFKNTHFNYVQFSLLFYSTALEKWRWIGRFDYNQQIDYLAQPGKYLLLNGLIWGAYKIHRKWHYHVGAMGYGGLEGETVYPIIGVDFAPNKKWFFQALFPINYSIEYKLRDHWTVSLKGKPMKERLRSGPHEPVPKSIFNYSTVGIEGNIHYEIPLRLTIEAYGGFNTGGKFYLKDGHGHNATYVRFGMAPYFGANLEYGF